MRDIKWPLVSRKRMEAEKARASKALYDQRVNHDAEIDDLVARRVYDKEKALEAIINELVRVKMRGGGDPSDPSRRTFQLALDFPDYLFRELTDMNKAGHMLDHIARTIMHKVRSGLVDFVRGKI